MLDLDTLEKLAKAANDPADLRFGVQEDYLRATLPPTILALIARVREAEVALSVTDTALGNLRALLRRHLMEAK